MQVLYCSNTIKIYQYLSSNWFSTALYVLEYAVKQIYFLEHNPAGLAS